MPTGIGSKSRSPSRDRSRSRSRSYDSYTSSYTDYSNESDNAPIVQSTASVARKPSNSKPGGAKGKGSLGKRPAGKPQGKAGGTTRDRDYVINRVLSGRRLKINELRNENEELKMQLIEITRENKLLMRTANQQDKKLHQYENLESDMPRIIANHNEEIRMNKEQLRRQKERGSRIEQKLKETEEDLNQTQRSLKKMKSLVADKKLDERDSLSRKLSRVEGENDDKDRRVKDLEKHVENLQKNHKHELGIERARQHKGQKEQIALKEQVMQLNGDLKDMKRDLEVSNIYANRGLKAGRSSTRNSTLISSPSPSRSLHHSRKNSQEQGMSTREKAKAFEAQKREQERQNKELFKPSSNKPQPIRAIHSIRVQANRTTRERGRRNYGSNVERSSRLSEEPQSDVMYKPQIQQSKRIGEPEEVHHSSTPDWLNTSLKNSRDHEEDVEEENRLEREAEERLREKEQIEWQLQQERTEREMRERFKREEQEQYEKEAALKEKEKKEKEERDRLAHQDKENQARKERERLAIEERTRLQLKQKESLLAKMQALNTGNDVSSVILNDPFAINTSTSKPPPRNDDIFDDPFSVPSSRKSDSKTSVESAGRKRGPLGSPIRKREINEYSYERSVDNLHNGLPANKPGSIFDDNDADGYQPTFLTQTPSTKQKGISNSNSKAKNNLMNDLFGSSATNSATKMDEVFGTSKSSAHSGNRRPPGGNIPVSFGDNNLSAKANSHLLPRRDREAPTTFGSSGRTTEGTFDDDIEEVML